ncbi:MAG TPA: hypothetical protein DHV28_15895 [Ignavibacteriales bacterium]|nr:hypothetical protein [Ignavibacteriales bacterium]
MKIFFLIFIFVTQLFAQHDFKPDIDLIQSGKFYNSELHFFPGKQDYSVYYSFKISYSQLFFQKKDDNFLAGIKVNIEVRDSSGSIINRVSKENSVAVNDFELTNSETHFLQGLLAFKLPSGKYKVLTSISDETSKRERRIPPFDLVINERESILNPIVVESEKINCENSASFILSNNSSSIPFNRPADNLFIPVTDSLIKFLNIIIKRGDTLFIENKKIEKYFIASSELINCSDKIIIVSNSIESGIKYFSIDSVSSKLTEGPVTIEIIPDNDINKKTVFNLNVIWIGKPQSLMDPEAAIKLLEIIEPKKVVSEVLNSGDNYSANLFNYWKKQDPTPNTNFNELMNEFYTRVDYCEMNFKNLAGNGGAKSDRGKVYIKYGPPDLINRDTNNKDKVAESWTYDKLKKKFVFVDIDGTGNFTLANGQ